MPEINSSLSSLFIGIFDDCHRVKPLTGLVHNCVDQILSAELDGVLRGRDGWPELFQGCPRVLHRKEHLVVAEKYVEAAFDLVMIDVIVLIQELHDAVDQHLVREEEAREDLKEIALCLTADLKGEDRR